MSEEVLMSDDRLCHLAMNVIFDHSGTSDNSVDLEYVDT
jgi:hypothetical protein